MSGIKKELYKIDLIRTIVIIAVGLTAAILNAEGSARWQIAQISEPGHATSEAGDFLEPETPVISLTMETIR